MVILYVSMYAFSVEKRHLAILGLGNEPQCHFTRLRFVVHSVRGEGILA